MTSRRVDQSHYARPGDGISYCAHCGKMIHLSRKIARLAARRIPPGDSRPRAYPCPSNAGYWHVGHIPDALRQGRIDRGQLRKGYGGKR